MALNIETLFLGFFFSNFGFEKPVKNLWEVIRNVNCARKRKVRPQNFSTTHFLLLIFVAIHEQKEFQSANRKI